jgi:plastocyanin
VKRGAALLWPLVLAVACDTPVGDLPSDASHSVLGPGLRLRDVQNPMTATAACNGPCAGTFVDITSVVVTAIDTFDETNNGKSIGTVFVQDADMSLPYSGISLYEPAFIPANLRVAPGDVVDMTNSEYTEQHTIGSTVNFGTAFLPQMEKPPVQLSFETQVPAPVVVNLSDLLSFSPTGTSAGGRQWIGMLITLQNVTVVGAPTGDGSGRVTAPITNTVNAPSINNELWNLPENYFPPGTQFTSITGIVDYFFNIFICPRSAADLVFAPGNDAGTDAGSDDAGDAGDGG